jgi:hypothetical protein
MARVSSAKGGDARSRTTRSAIHVLTLTGLLVAVSTVTSAFALVRGRSWVVNGPDTGYPLSFVPQIDNADMDIWKVATALDLPVATRILSAVPGVVLGAALAVAAFLVVRVLREIAHGRTFSVAARLGLGRISLVLMLGGVLSAVLDLVALLSVEAAINPLRESWTRELREDAPHVAVSTVPSVPVLVIVLGVVAAAAMFALADGARLEDEAEGVI